MWERACFSTTILAQLRTPRRSRHPYAAPRTSLQFVCTRRRNCIERLSPSPEYALGTVDLPSRPPTKTWPAHLGGLAVTLAAILRIVPARLSSKDDETTSLVRLWGAIRRHHTGRDNGQVRTGRE